MSRITTHVLDTASGGPAAGLAIRLEHLEPGTGVPALVGRGTTDANGRSDELVPTDYALAPGVYRLSFDTGAYFRRDRRAAFFPTVDVTFRVDEAAGRLHVPLLLSPYGYSTYRGG